MTESFSIPRRLSEESLRLLTTLDMAEIERRLQAEPPKEGEGEGEGEPPMEKEPTDQELLQLMPQQFQDDLATVSRMAAHGATAEVKPGIFRVSLNAGALDFARVVLARWGRQALQPVPVSEMPWEREGWRDRQGCCWMGDPGGSGFIPSWRLCTPEDAPSMSVSLPAHALPLPEVTE